MQASAKYAVLGLLLERPSYGSELLARFRRAFVGARWALSAQALYAALDRLERGGLIEPLDGEAHTGSRRQPKRPYRVTAAGVRELRRFLDAPMGADASRAELLVRLRCATTAGADALPRLLDAHERACREELGRLEAGGDGETALADRLAREQLRIGVAARLAWVDYARGQLGAPRADDGDAPPSRERVGAA